MSTARILRSDRAWFVLAALCFTALTLHFWKVPLDDVFISFRYAENLLHGRGLVYNPGERIEGYSNLLYTLLLIPLAAAGVSLLVAAKILSLLAGLGILALHLAWPGSSAWARRATVLALAGSHGLALWAGIALETVFYLFLIQAATFLLVRGVHASGSPRRRELAGSGLLYGLAAVTRPEGAIFFLPALFLLRRRNVGPQAILSFLLFVLPVLGQFLFRWVYYGNLLPQTFYTKVGFDPAMSLQGIRRIFLSFVFFCLTPLGILALWPRPRLWKRGGPDGDGAFLFWAQLWLTLVFVAVVGWDWMPGKRFALTALPGGLWLLVRGFEEILERHPARRFRNAIAGALVLAVWASSARMAAREARAYSLGSWWSDPSLRWEDWVDPDRLRIARWLQEHAPAGAVIATGEAGLVPWITGHRVVDTWGLMDPVVGALVRPMRPEAMVRYRESGPQHPIAEYVRSRSPDFLFTDREEVIPPEAPAVLDGSYTRVMESGRYLIFARAPR